MKKYSIWLDNVNSYICNKVNKNMEVDVLIVGGGITGISALYQLSKANCKTILIERNVCGHGVTARSTAKITYLQENIYNNIRKYSEDKALLYLKSQIEAVNTLKDIIEENNIKCDLEKVSSYIFTNVEKNIKQINQEYEFLKKANVNVKKVNKIPFDVNMKLGLKVDDTYVFHPLKYINFFKEKYKKNIYENSKLEEINKEKDYYICKVNDYIIKAKYVIIATHYPYFLFPFLMPVKSHVETSYVGAKVVNSFNNISAINIDKEAVSFRYHKDINNYLIYLDNSMISCNVDSIQTNFKELAKHYDFLWSNKDIITNDYIPLIGRIYKNDNTFLMASGYNTWGFTNATLAGSILADIIIGNKNKYEKLFEPNRSFNFSKFKRFPIDVGASIKAIFKSTKNNVNNKNVIHKKINGINVLVYIDENNKEHIVLNKCPHMKCGLVFNEIEKTWDCLCHGSRFDIDGKCIEGPSNYDITFKNI